MNMIFRLQLVNESNEILVNTAQKEPYHTIVLGKGTYLKSSTMHFSGGRKGNISIGNYTYIANDCIFLMGMNHDYTSVSNYPFEDILHDKCATNHCVNTNHYQIIIGHDVCIGQNVTIMGGVRIGNGAVIAAHSVVTHDVPPYAIVGGIPAQTIKYRFSTDIIRKFQVIKWWYWDIETITQNIDDMNNPQIFAEKYYKESMNNYPPIILNEVKKLGRIIFFLADLESTDGIYNDVIKQYSTFITRHPGYILLIGVDNKYKQAGENVLEESSIDGNKVYIYYYDTEHAYEDVLSVASFMISNGEKVFMKYYDCSLDYKVKVLNGFDADIFESLKTGGIPKEQPVLTIGIPTYNRLKYLQKCLSYVCDAVGNDSRVEILVSDNASKEDVKRYMNSLCLKYDNLTYVRQEKNGGAAANVDYIWGHAKGLYTWVVGDDDYLSITAINVVIDVLQNNKNLSLLSIVSKPGEYELLLNNDINIYMKTVTFVSTSLVSFITRTDMVNLEDFQQKKRNNEFLGSCMIPQVAMQLEVLHMCDKYGVLMGAFFMPENGESVFITPEQYKELGEKYGFPDLGSVFIHQFLTILNMYKTYGITDETIRYVMKNLFDVFLVNWCELSSKQCVRWQTGSVIKWYDKYYKNEEYYEHGRRILTDILKNVDLSLKEDGTDFAPYLE